MAHSHLDGLVLEDTISQAFAGVCLNGGISLRQAQIIDKRDDALSDKDFDNLPAKEITDDWSQIPLSELDRDCIAHLDEKGFLYYIPALMLSVLHNYDASSMRVIGTLHALYAKPMHEKHHERIFVLLNDAQRSSIASFLDALPRLVNLESEDAKIASRALRNYWARYLVKDMHVT